MVEAGEEDEYYYEEDEMVNINLITLRTGF